MLCSNLEEPAHPSVSFTTKGGSQFPMLAPIVVLIDRVSKEEKGIFSSTEIRS
jgi:hypothetical protein